MKITHKNSTPTFQSIEITLVIENEQELENLKRVAGLDSTIPNAVAEHYDGKRAIATGNRYSSFTRELLRGLYRAANEATNV